VVDPATRRKSSPSFPAPLAVTYDPDPELLLALARVYRDALLKQLSRELDENQREAHEIIQTDNTNDDQHQAQARLRRREP
jgi:hypothetical protein